MTFQVGNSVVYYIDDDATALPAIVLAVHASTLDVSVSCDPANTDVATFMTWALANGVVLATHGTFAGVLYILGVSAGSTRGCYGTTYSLHASTHQSGGVDPLGLDTLAAPTNSTALNASPTAHGLLPRLSGSPDDVLHGDGAWGDAAPLNDNANEFLDDARASESKA